MKEVFANHASRIEFVTSNASRRTESRTILTQASQSSTSLSEVDVRRRTIDELLSDEERQSRGVSANLSQRDQGRNITDSGGRVSPGRGDRTAATRTLALG